ncbi:MAG: acyl-CoA dehydrogenase family protein [Geminicoccaceae bacterium]
MDFALNDDQRAWRERARRFASTSLGRDLAERDRRGALDVEDWRQGWQECAAFGLLGLCVPQAYGGLGLDIVTTVMVLEAIGEGCADNGLTLAVNGQIWAVQEPIMSFGSEAQKARYLPELASGRLIGAHGMTEAETGSDAFSLQTSATRADGGYVLNGCKTYVGLAPACGLAVIFATTRPDRGRWGLSAFLVEADRPGFGQAHDQQKLGLRTVPMGEIHLCDCWVPEDNRLGPEGAGASIFQNTMVWERSFIFASHVGAMRRQLDDCVTYAKRRQVFGRSIDQFQSVSNRLAEMKLRLETSRLLLYQAAWLLDRGEDATMAAALAKLHISESFAASSLDALRIHGGKGYLAGHSAERDLRDALGGVIYSGTSDIQREVIARLLAQ